MIPNTWFTDYTIAGKHYWKCASCQSVVLVSENNMNFCGHCGEPKYYLTTEKKQAELRRQK